MGREKGAFKEFCFVLLFLGFGWKMDNKKPNLSPFFFISHFLAKGRGGPKGFPTKQNPGGGRA